MERAAKLCHELLTNSSTLWSGQPSCAMNDSLTVALYGVGSQVEPRDRHRSNNVFVCIDIHSSQQSLCGSHSNGLLSCRPSSEVWPTGLNIIDISVLVPNTNEEYLNEELDWEAGGRRLGVDLTADCGQLFNRKSLPESGSSLDHRTDNVIFDPV
ncbi:hypothetical protein J6590_014253 [Homalodisca vitripennis]|nr:hypothetical protein J6590_014253 [Homalodisca vitripennis]